jgi:hypothetical protein
LLIKIKEGKEEKMKRVPICPNCTADLRLKPCESRVFRWYANLGYLVQACTECLSDPTKLDGERITENLIKLLGWSVDAATQAAKAIITGEATVVAEIVDGVVVPVEEVKEPVIPTEEALIPQEAVTTGKPVLA